MRENSEWISVGLPGIFVLIVLFAQVVIRIVNKDGPERDGGRSHILGQRALLLSLAKQFLSFVSWFNALL